MARELKLRAADDRSPGEAWDAFRRFEEAWKPIAAAIPDSPNLTSAGRGHGEIVQRLTTEVASALNHPALYPFDRLQVAVAARNLVRVLTAMSDRLYADASVDTETRSLGGATLLAGRELVGAIDRRMTRMAIISAYEEWRRTWGDLVKAARDAPRTPPDIIGDWERIRAIDRALNDLLYVEPMPGETPEPTAVVMKQLLQATEFLACELREERAPSEALLRSDSLALAVQERSWVGKPAPPYIRDRDYARVLYDWDRLREAMGQVDYASAQDSHQALDAIAALVEKIRLRYVVLHSAERNEGNGRKRL